MASPYCRYPHVHGNDLIFVARDQLWLATLNGGATTTPGTGTSGRLHPFFSPDGQSIAFAEGSSLFVSDRQGRERRLTDLPGPHRPLGWHGDRVLVSTNACSPFASLFELYSVDPVGAFHAYSWGSVASAAFSAEHGTVICRHEVLEPSAWKRYRGGARGDFWIDRESGGRFEPFRPAGLGDANLSRPCWAGDRIYFLSDHEGIGRVYSCRANGQDVQRHGPESDFYARHLSSDGETLVFSLEGDLWSYRPREGDCRRIPVELPEADTSEREAGLLEEIEEIAAGASGKGAALVARGQLVRAEQLTSPTDAPVRLARATGTGELLAVREKDGADWFVSEGANLVRYPEGRILAWEPGPGKRTAVGNHRNELHLFDFGTGLATRIDHCDREAITEFSWSPDGATLVYVFHTAPELSQLKVWSTGQASAITDPGSRVRAPVFGNRGGGFIYFLFQTRAAFGGAPAEWQPSRMSAEGGARAALPLPPGDYPLLWPGPRGGVLYLGRDGGIKEWDPRSGTENSLGISATRLSFQHGQLAWLDSDMLHSRDLATGETQSVSLAGRRVRYDARAEWRHLFRSVAAWQKDFFWDPDLGALDWEKKQSAYAALLPKVGSRAECIDLLWQLLGELSTSHAYLFDTRKAVSGPPDDRPKRYQRWQKECRGLVEAEGGGKVAYVHVPDTSPAGFHEFRRQYLSGYERPSLILDLRFNSGGSWSDLVLDLLLRRALGEIRTRDFRPQPYPPLANRAKLVVLTNCFTGSDGEMLALCLRLQAGATILGTRTWGGVTGFRGHTRMVGGGFSTQPRTVFQIEGAPAIENVGVVPDVEIEAESGSRDLQLLAAIEAAQRA